MTDGLRDLLTVLRCGRFAVGLPAAIRFAFSGAREVVRAFDRIVVPLIERVIADAALRTYVADSLRFASVKVSYLLSSYSTMARLPFHVELSMLGGAFARLYDDLIDDIDGVELDDRLADLFQGRPFTPLTELEYLLYELYQAIDSRLGRPRDDAVYVALDALHEYQVLSRHQKDPDISRDLLRKVTTGKGGLANVALFALMRPNMDSREWDLVMRLGEALQLLDDYTDYDVDRRAGITTVITRGAATLREVVDRLRALRPHLLSFYGATLARQFVGVLYVLLLASVVKRRRPATKRRLRATRPAINWPTWILITSGHNVVPPRELMDR